MIHFNSIVKTSIVSFHSYICFASYFHSTVDSIMRKAIEIIRYENDSFQLHGENLKSILNKCAKKKIVIYSIVGEYQTGKSTLLDAIIRHYYGFKKDEKISGM